MAFSYWLMFSEIDVMSRFVSYTGKIPIIFLLVWINGNLLSLCLIDLRIDPAENQSSGS
jgi:hypothetical protein